MLLYAIAAMLMAGAEPSAAEGLKPGEKKVKVICRTEAATGTRMPKRTCMSVEDIRKREDQSKEAFSAMQSNTLLNPTKGN